MMVADKFPNGLIGLIGLRIIRTIGTIGTIRRGYHFPILPINSTSISTAKFVVRRVADVALT